MIPRQFWKLCQWEGWNPSRIQEIPIPQAEAQTGEIRDLNLQVGVVSRPDSLVTWDTLWRLYDTLIQWLDDTTEIPFLSLSKFKMALENPCAYHVFDAVPRKNGGLPLPGLISRGYRMMLDDVELLNNLTTLQQTNIAMDNGPFIDDLSGKNCNFHSNNCVGLPEGQIRIFRGRNFHEFTWIYIAIPKRLPPQPRHWMWYGNCWDTWELRS